MDCQAVASGLTATQRHAYTQTPGAGFFDAFETAFEKLEQQETTASSAGSDSSAPVSSLADVLGATQTELADVRGVSVQDQREYAAILQKAYANDALSTPKQFLQSLSSSELDVVRHIRGLADPINPSALSDEGASNLLLPEGYSVDLNHDGIDEVGAAKTLHFPPRDAPAAFTDAWFQATQGESFGDYSMHAMTFLLAFHPPGDTGNATTGLPTDQLGSYKTVVDNYLSMLDHCQGMLAEGQYERDQPFFSSLRDLLQGTPTQSTPSQKQGVQAGSSELASVAETPK
jgi:hypothetical protein